MTRPGRLAILAHTKVCMFRIGLQHEDSGRAEVVWNGNRRSLDHYGLCLLLCNCSTPLFSAA